MAGVWNDVGGEGDDARPSYKGKGKGRGKSTANSQKSKAPTSTKAPTDSVTPSTSSAFPSHTEPPSDVPASNSTKAPIHVESPSTSSAFPTRTDPPRDVQKATKAATATLPRSTQPPSSAVSTTSMARSPVPPEKAEPTSSNHKEISPPKLNVVQADNFDTQPPTTIPATTLNLRRLPVYRRDPIRESQAYNYRHDNTAPRLCAKCSGHLEKGNDDCVSCVRVSLVATFACLLTVLPFIMWKVCLSGVWGGGWKFM